MEVTEIRNNKKALIPFIIVLCIGVVGISYYVFFTEKGRGNYALQIIQGVMTISLIYSIYRMIQHTKKNEPVIILTKSSIDINENGKLISFIWLQISDWKVEQDDNTYYLKITAGDIKKKVNISWLEKKPTDIEALINKYSSKTSAFDY